ncbi:MAG: tRNA (N(6)-L-threonylcarbamoyladenosine(37)-C(2))-methylthiotransferase, partial [Methanothrix sp.]|nr:tRNA (N(6)-L-threonylcarbamoyladenosine(37)-C(2))-methylthiotransferase [Methanothrix sp.]
MKFYIETYGCTANQGNSQDLAQALQEMGHIPSSLDEADAVIVNTCAVTEKTERKTLRRLNLLQGERLVVSGCLPAAMPESIRLINCRERLGLLSGSAATKIADLFADSHPAKPFDASKCAPNEPHATPVALAPRQNLCGIVNIASGCDGCCSYCIVRKARGKLVSRDTDEVVEAVKNLANSGIAEVQLAAQDTAAFGQDRGDSLPELIDKIDDVPGRFKVRVGMMNPDTARSIQRRLIEAFHSPKVYKFLHMPVQSGSNRILKSMRRRYTAEDFLTIVDAFRSQFPDLSLITDVIVGFPGETEEDFRQTMDLIKSLRPDKVNVTRFSRRPGTRASLLYDMPDRIKKDRSRELTRLWLEIAGTRTRRYVGQVLDARVTECGK